MQFLAKFKKILNMGFRATLNFRIFKVALNSMYRIFSNFAKSCISSWLSKFYNKEKFHRAVLKYKGLKLKLRVFLAVHSVAMVTVPFLKYKPLRLKLRVFLVVHSVAMVTYSATKIIPSCSPMIGQSFDTMICNIN